MSDLSCIAHDVSLKGWTFGCDQEFTEGVRKYAAEAISNSLENGSIDVGFYLPLGEREGRALDNPLEFQISFGLDDPDDIVFKGNLADVILEEVDLLGYSIDERVKIATALRALADKIG